MQKRRKYSAEYKREAEHPLTHGLFGQHLIHQQGRAFGHAPARPATGAKTPTFTTEGDQVALRDTSRSAPARSRIRDGRI